MFQLIWNWYKQMFKTQTKRLQTMGRTGVNYDHSFYTLKAMHIAQNVSGVTGATGPVNYVDSNKAPKNAKNLESKSMETELKANSFKLNFLNDNK